MQDPLFVRCQAGPLSAFAVGGSGDTFCYRFWQAFGPAVCCKRLEVNRVSLNLICFSFQEVKSERKAGCKLGLFPHVHPHTPYHPSHF